MKPQRILFEQAAGQGGTYRRLWLLGTRSGVARLGRVPARVVWYSRAFDAAALSGYLHLRRFIGRATPDAVEGNVSACGRLSVGRAPWRSARGTSDGNVRGPPPTVVALRRPHADTLPTNGRL